VSASIESIARRSPHGALPANVYGRESGIGEYVIGAILALSREFSRLDKALWRGIGRVSGRAAAQRPSMAGTGWQDDRILGHGRIGQSIARRARAFDMQVYAVRREVENPPKIHEGFV